MSSPGKYPVNGTTGVVLTIPAPTQPGAFIRILSADLFASATSTVTFLSAANEIGRAYLGTGNSFSRTDEVSGIMDCNPGEAFTLNNTAGTIGGEIVAAVFGAG